jgi:hypothetical protein
MKHLSSDVSPTTHHIEEANAMKNPITDTEASVESITDHDDTTASEVVNSTEGSKSAKRKGTKAEPNIQPMIPKVRIVKVGTCPSLSGRSELTYHIGCIGEAIQLRVYQNSGKGYFNQEWISFTALMDSINDQMQVTAASLRSVFVGKSVNTAGFFLAVLKDLGVIERSTENQRSYKSQDFGSFETETRQLMASGISIEVAEKLDIKPSPTKKGTLKLKSKKP